MSKTWSYSKKLQNKSGKLVRTDEKRETSVPSQQQLPQQNYTAQKSHKSTTKVQIHLNGHKVTAIIDSGAACTLISKDMWIIFKSEMKQPKSNKKWLNANGGQMNCIGSTYVTISIGKLEVNHKCSVIDGLQSKVLLGTDFLAKHGCIVDYIDRKLKMGSVQIPIKTRYQQEDICLVITNAIVLKANSESIHYIKTNASLGSELLVENISNNQSKIWVRDGLVMVKDNKIPVIIQNKNSFNVTLAKNTTIAKMVSFNQIQLVESPYEENRNIKQYKKASELINWSKCLQSNEWIIKTKKLIDKYDHIFSKHSADLGHFNKAKFDINTGQADPIKLRPYRVPYATVDNIDKMVDEMLQGGLISKSNSPWAAPIVIVKKKDGTDRFCIDFRKLNSVTSGDNYPIPLMEETLDKLRGAEIFSSIDLASGYWQIALHDNAKEKTAFITHKGLFQFEVMPFGLKNAGAFFQRTMEQVLQDLPNSSAYLDDVITASTNTHKHLEDLENLFKRIESANLKIKPSKCVFGASEIKFLGFQVSKSGIKPDQDKTRAVKTYPTPKNAKQIKRFMGFASYYRKFIPNFADIMEPMVRLLKKGAKFIWSNQCQEGFENMIDLLTKAPILAFPNFKNTFILTTDASTVGLGAVLSQIDSKNNERVISYASRSLRPAERNYAAHELECLAIVWGCEQFRAYLYGRHFKIYCDHNPLVYLDNYKVKSARFNRWRLLLNEYDKEIIYKKGSKNTNADALSRLDEVAINHVITTPIDDNLITKLQNEDKEIQQIIKDLKRQNKTMFNNFYMDNNLLYATKHIKNVKVKRIVVPEVLVETVLTTCHDDMSGGHLGFKKTWPKVRDRFYWKTMYRDTKNWVESCSKCASRKTPSTKRAQMVPINNATKPFDMVGVDILGPLPETYSGNKYLLVFTDYLTKWPEAFPISRIDAKTIAKVFINEIISRHGAPKILLSDQGRQFMANLVKEICDYFTTNKINTTAYHPQCNGLTERFNATICQILSMYIKENQTNWDQMVPIALFAYRTSVQESTEETPFEVLYGRSPKLPSDLEKLTKNEFTTEFKHVWKSTQDKIKKAGVRQKTHYDSLHQTNNYEPGDYIRLNSPATKTGRVSKLRNDKWHGPYQIISKDTNGNLEISVNGKTSKIHENRAKPVKFKENAHRVCNQKFGGYNLRPRKTL